MFDHHLLKFSKEHSIYFKKNYHTHVYSEQDGLYLNIRGSLGEMNF